MPKNRPEDVKLLSKDITDEMKSAYVNYAMSVITSRALPDVRDGLKPVQRRILYAMSGMGLKSSAKTRKSAAIVGEVLGKYHPHGNMAVYEAMVKLGQEFTTRYPLVIGQGNFGSIDGDPPAAERYTEAKMSVYAEKMLEGIEKNTVPFVPNYEGTTEEPTVLPSVCPNLLLNGTLGIAVGMATDIPPHNLNEVCDAVEYLIENPKATTTDLLKFIKGPDFPLGAIAYDKKAIAQAYATGRGGVVVRGEIEAVEEKQKSALIITSLPYRVNKARLIEKIGDLVRNKKIEGIKDLRDESTDDIRIVIELKSNAQPHRIQNSIFKYTQLEDTYHYNIVCLHSGVPQTMTLHQLLQAYIDHRRDMVYRATEFDLAKAKARAHILDGLKKALDHIDKIIALIKKSKDVAAARVSLMKTFSFSEIQANAILEMRLQKLAGLERKKIEDELKDVNKLIVRLSGILKSKKKVDNEIIASLEEIKKKFGDKRRTKIESKGQKVFDDEDLILEKQNLIMMTEDGYIKRTAYGEYKRQRRGGLGVKGAGLKDEDATTISVSTSSHNTLLFFTNKEKIYRLKAYEIPEGKRTTKGRAIVNFISMDANERVTSIVSVDKKFENDSYLFFVTANGVVKRVKLSQFENIRKTGLTAITLNKGDTLVKTMLCTDKDDIIIATANGKGIRFSVKSIRPSLGRTAQGVRGINLGEGDRVIGALAVSDELKKTAHLLTISERGVGKRTSVSAFPLRGRGGSGIKVATVNEKTGKLAVLHLVESDDEEFVTMSKKGQMARISAKEIPISSRVTQGVSLMRLKSGDLLATSSKM